MANSAYVAEMQTRDLESATQVLRSSVLADLQDQHDRLMRLLLAGDGRSSVEKRAETVLTGVITARLALETALGMAEEQRRS